MLREGRRSLSKEMEEQVEVWTLEKGKVWEASSVAGRKNEGREKKKTKKSTTKELRN